MTEVAAPESSGVAHSSRPPTNETALNSTARRRATLLGFPIALTVLGLCAALGLLIRVTVYAA
jgi:hypothetical protein